MKKQFLLCVLVGIFCSLALLNAVAPEASSEKFGIIPGDYTVESVTVVGRYLPTLVKEITVASDGKIVLKGKLNREASKSAQVYKNVNVSDGRVKAVSVLSIKIHPLFKKVIPLRELEVKERDYKIIYPHETQGRWVNVHLSIHLDAAQKKAYISFILEDPVIKDVSKLRKPI